MIFGTWPKLLHQDTRVDLFLSVPCIYDMKEVFPVGPYLNIDRLGLLLILVSNLTVTSVSP